MKPMPQGLKDKLSSMATAQGIFEGQFCIPPTKIIPFAVSSVARTRSSETYLCNIKPEQN